MTEEKISYNDLYSRYENSKHLIKEVRTSFNGSFQGVTSLLQRYATTLNAEFITELTNVLTNTKAQLETLFTSAADPGLFKPTQLEQTITDYKIERQQGMAMVQNLRSQIDTLQEEKRNWSIREEKGKKLIEQYQLQTQQNKPKNGTYNNANIDSDNTALEYDTNTGQLQKQISVLTTDKMRLSSELETYKKRLSKTGGNTAQLFRNDTVTEWNEDDLAAMKEEMRKEMKQQHQEALERQFERQFALRTEIQQQSEVKQEPSNEEETETETETDSLKPKPYDRLFRDGTKTDWDESELAELKKHMKSEMQVMATKQKQEQIMRMSELNDAIRDPNIQQMNEQKREANEEKEKQAQMKEKQEMLMAQKQLVLGAMADRNDNIRDDQANESASLAKKKAEKVRQSQIQDQQDMNAEMARLKKQKLAAQFDRNYDLVTASTSDVVNTKVVVENIDEAKEMEQRMIAYQKQELGRKTDPSTAFMAEPQIKPNHETVFMELMKQIGIVNTNDIQRLWDHIETTVNEDKRTQIISVGGHSVSKSMMYDSDNTEMESIDKETMESENIGFLKQELESVKLELAQMKEERELEEDDYGILETGITTTKGGADDYKELEVKIENLSEENQRLNTTNKTITSKLEDMNDEIYTLKEETKRIANSKIKVLKNTSKEIDSLRSLLQQYVKLASEQKNKLLNR